MLCELHVLVFVLVLCNGLDPLDLVHSCGPGKVPCPKGDKCIKPSQVCDGHCDCEPCSRSDEPKDRCDSDALYWSIFNNKAHREADVIGRVEFLRADNLSTVYPKEYCQSLCFLLYDNEARTCLSFTYVSLWRGISEYFACYFSERSSQDNNKYVYEDEVRFSDLANNQMYSMLYFQVFEQRDRDECDMAESRCPYSCENTLGSYECVCGPGRDGDMVDGECKDIDECELQFGGHNCSPDTKCLNTDGSFACECVADEGFGVGGGRSSGGCSKVCAPHAWCVAGASGQYECQCSVGYYRVTGGCSDVDECDNSQHRCTINEKCVNTAGSFLCERSRERSRIDFITAHRRKGNTSNFVAPTVTIIIAVTLIVVVLLAAVISLYFYRQHHHSSNTPRHSAAPTLSKTTMRTSGGTLSQLMINEGERIVYIDDVPYKVDIIYDKHGNPFLMDDERRVSILSGVTDLVYPVDSVSSNDEPDEMAKLEVAGHMMQASKGSTQSNLSDRLAQNLNKYNENVKPPEIGGPKVLNHNTLGTGLEPRLRAASRMMYATPVFSEADTGDTFITGMHELGDFWGFHSVGGEEKGGEMATNVVDYVPESEGGYKFSMQLDQVADKSDAYWKIGESYKKDSKSSTTSSVIAKHKVVPSENQTLSK